MPEDIEFSLPYRETYQEGLYAVLEARRAEMSRQREARITPARMAQNREAFREEFADLLGWPLNCYEAYRDQPMQVRKELQGENDFSKIYRMQFEVLPNLWFYGIFFEHKNTADALPFVICQHGGQGTPERISGLWDTTSNYNDLLARTARHGHGANTFAPGLCLWSDDYGPKRERETLDRGLKQVGSSIAALEVFSLRRVLDYFIREGIAREGHIGMVGLSYGGSYTLLCAAADTRIRAAYSSCQYNDRYRYNWGDWTWKGSAALMDAEMAALVAPRALFLEEGDNDELFAWDSFLEECKRVEPFFAAANAADKLKYRVFNGNHELCKDDQGFDFLFANL